MVRKWVAGFLFLVTPTLAQANCIDLSGHYVLVSKEHTSLIQLTQKSCEKVTYSVLAIRGDRVKPLASIDYLNGEGFKLLPGDQGTEYELLLQETKGTIRMKKAGSNGSICMDTVQFERDPYQNLVGIYSRICNNDDVPNTRTIIFHAL